MTQAENGEPQNVSLWHLHKEEELLKVEYLISLSEPPSNHCRKQDYATCDILFYIWYTHEPYLGTSFLPKLKQENL